MASRKVKGDYDGKIAGLYDLGDTIGRGHFAVVKLARHVFTGERVAVKVIDKTKLDEVSKTHLFQEVRCMKLVQHPNVVRLYEVIDTQTKLYLILELGDGGDMYDYIMKQDRGLSENTSRKYFRQIVEAISYCHQLHVVHRDLKPENVVFFEKLGIVKLTDFGFSNMFNPGKNLETSCGSLAYSAPEILLGDSYDAPAVDVWSLGVILYMLVCGHAPFQEANDSETLTKIMDCKYKVPVHVSHDCIQLISRMLVREPGHRASLNDIMNHTWLKGLEPLPPVYMPLISREHVSEEDHNHVLHRMIDGNIASKEEILHALEKDNYDHVAATYYLLVERRLKKARQDMMQSAAATYQIRRQSNGSQTNKPHLEPLALSPRKHRELKKTKTAPLSTSDRLMPVASPSEASGSADCNPFMKSLTMSMTLDRRKRQQSLGIIPATMTSPLRMRKQMATGQTTSMQTGDKHTKKKSDSFSKIAILSSFFERKAAVAAGKATPPDLRAAFFKKHRTPSKK